MRIILSSDIAAAASEMCRKASTSAAPGVASALSEALDDCPEGPAREALRICLENISVAASSNLPLCQDTGIAVFFVELGTGVRISGGTLEGSIAAGVAEASREGFLRPSMVADPFGERVNTGDSTPPVIHLETVEGDILGLRLVLRGAGTENASRTAMLPPHAGGEGISDFVLASVSETGAAACPPLIVSVGVGGNLETCVLLSKKGLFRTFGTPSEDSRCAALERSLLTRLNRLGIGPQGFGGCCTALEVRVSSAPCHMASLPVSVCMGCHALRTAEAAL